MTNKLEELKAALEAADAAVKVAWATADAAWVAYREELKKIQQENLND